MTRKIRRRKLTPQDLFKLRIITGLAMSPDEKRVAYCVERMDPTANKYFKNIYVLDITSGESRQFTHGDHNDGQPVWSPDGFQMAFVSIREKKAGVYLMPSAGGAERKLLEIEGTLASLQWTPDCRQLVFVLRYNDSHFIKDEKNKEELPVFRHITKLFYRLDGEGFLPKDTFQVYALHVASAKLRPITKGKRDNLSPHISPDGRWIAYTSNRAKDPYLDSRGDASAA